MKETPISVERNILKETPISIERNILKETPISSAPEAVLPYTCTFVSAFSAKHAPPATVSFAADMTVFGAMAGDRGAMLLTSQGKQPSH